MREIKFRFWLGNKMKYDWELLTHKEHGIQTINKVLTEPFIKAMIMQYTGLKDKNGKEIYEGDIVKCDPGWGNLVFEDVVAFEQGVFGVKMKNLSGQMLKLTSMEVEILGNVYENPI